MSEINNSNPDARWFEVDAQNTAPAPDGFPQADGQDIWIDVPQNGRALMGAIKRFWDRINSTLTTTGSAGAYVYTPSNTAFPTEYVQGETYSFKTNFSSVGSDTLNINALGALGLFKPSASGPIALAAGDIQSGQIATVVYDSALASGAGGFQVVAGLPSSATRGASGAEASLASAATTDLGGAGSQLVNVTGTTTITSFGSSAVTSNPIYFLRFSDALTLTYNAASLILPGSANITTAAGDAAIFEYMGSGNWRCLVYQTASGQPVAFPTIANNLVIANISGTTAAPSGTDLSALLDSAMGSAGGDILVRGSGAWSAVALSGDATLSNSGALTLDTVNSNVGSFTTANITVNAKGLITAAANGTITQTNSVQVRQCVQAAAVSNGYPTWLSSGTGLSVNMAATSTPVKIAFANGFGSNGAQDNIGQLTADQAGYWSSLPANVVSFLSVDRNTGTGALTATDSIVPPQYNQSYDAASMAILQFENNLNDDWGNAAWTNNGGATFSSSVVKFGTYSIALNGSSQYLSTARTQLLNTGGGPFTAEGWFYTTTASTTQAILNVGGTTSSYAAFALRIASSKLNIYASSTGSSWDIANAVGGTTTVTSNAWHHWAVTWDGITYRVFLDGNVEISITSSSVMTAGTQTLLGVFETGGGPSYSYYFNGYLDSTRLDWRCCRYTANFTPPSAAFTPDGDFFSIATMQMQSATGAGPTFGDAFERVYVGEAQAGTTSIGSVINYAYQGQYVGAWTNTLLTSQLVTANDNLGTIQKHSDFEIQCITPEQGYNVGTIVRAPGGWDASYMIVLGVITTRNTSGISAMSNYYGQTGNGTGRGGITPANWAFRFLAKRNF